MATGCAGGRLLTVPRADLQGGQVGPMRFIPSVILLCTALTAGPVRAQTPALYDLTATVLGLFGIGKLKDMIGSDIF